MPWLDFRERGNLPHLRRLGFVPMGTQRLGAGLTSFAPPALKRKAPAADGGRYKNCLQLQGFERDVLGGNEEFADEGGFGGAAAKGFFGGDAHEIGVVVFLRNVREHEITDAGIEALGIGEKFADGVIGEVPGAGEDALLDDPGIRADLEHVEIVIGF